MTTKNLTYVVLGKITNPPTNGEVLEVPLSEPNAQALYEARKEAMLSVKTKYACLLDGGEDNLLLGFESDINSRLEEMDRNPRVALSYADERQGVTPGKLGGTFTLSKYVKDMPAMMHHGVIVRTSVLKRVIWPDGCYWFEGVAYGALASLGFIYHPRVVYEWNPSPNGARMWSDTSTAISNTKKWLLDTETPKFTDKDWGDYWEVMKPIRQARRLVRPVQKVDVAEVDTGAAGAEVDAVANVSVDVAAPEVTDVAADSKE